MFGFELWALEQMGLIHNEKGQYRLSEKAAYYYHYIEQAYTTAYIDKCGTFPEGLLFRMRLF